jgi:hypothetical protein
MRGFPLTGPQCDLTLHIALWPAEPLKPGRAPIHAMQCRKYAGQILIDGSAVRGAALTHHPVGKYPSLNVIHNEERCAEDRFVLTQQPHARHRHVGLGQRCHDAVFTLDLVGPGQQLARWLLAQHVVPTGSMQMIGGVALSALELTNLQLTIETRQTSAQIPGQSGLVEAVCGQHRDQLCHPLHLLPLSMHAWSR